MATRGVVRGVRVGALRLFLLAASGVPVSGLHAQEPPTTPLNDGPATPLPDGPVESETSLEVIPVDAGKPEDATARDNEPAQLEEVIVTSQKTKQNVREVPASVTAISGEALRDSKILSPNDLDGYVPSTEIKVSPYTAEIRIRGYGTPVSNPGFESSVGLVVDDVYYGRAPFLAALMYDVNRLEVIRGPQGALFGKNTIAGVINVATVDPDDTVAGDLTVYSRDDLGIVDVRGGVSIPITDGVYSRFGGAVTEYQGQFYNTDLNRPEFNLSSDAGRAKVRFTNVLGGELKLSVSTSDQRANGNLFQLSKASPATLAFFKTYDARVETDPYNNLLSSNVPSQIDVTTETAQANYTLPLGSVWGLTSLDLTSVSAYGKINILHDTIDFDFSPAPVVREDAARSNPYSQYSQEFRFSGESQSLFGLFGRTDFIGGLYYLHSDLLADSIVRVEDLSAAAGLVIAARGNNLAADASEFPIGGTLATQFANLLGMATTSGVTGAALASQTAKEQAELILDQSQQSIAAFGQVTTYLTDELAAILGWRFGYETKDGHSVSEAPQGAIFIPAVLGQSNHDNHLSISATESSPKVGLKYDFTKSVSTYAIYGKGFKGGGFNGLPFGSADLQYGPETANSYETGIKARWFDKTLDTNLALYRTDFANLQVSSFNGTSFNVVNAASARSQGVDADFRWQSPFQGTTVEGNAGYNNAKYISYPDGPATAESSASSQDLSGKTLASAPRWTASLIPTVSIPSWSPTWGFQFSVEGLYQSQRYLDVDLDPNVLQKGETQLNARASVGAINRSWSFTIFGSNLTAVKILNQVTDEPVAPGNFGAVRADRGREIFGALKLNF